METVRWINIVKTGRICGLLCLVLPASFCLGELPTDPNSAASLYHQAFLLCPDCGQAVRRGLEIVSYGGEPNTPVRAYVKRCQSALRYAEKASQIPTCDWGLRHSPGLGQQLSHVNPIRHLSRVMHAEARILAGERDDRAAFTRCFALRRMAEHVGDETILSYACAMGVRGEADRAICQILGSLPPSMERIDWLTHQLAALPPSRLSAAKALKMEGELTVHSMRASDAAMKLAKARLAEAVARGEVAEEQQNLSDEEFLEYAHKPYRRFLDSVLSIRDDAAYEDARVQIEKLIADLNEEVANDPVCETMRLHIAVSAEGARRLYWAKMLGLAQQNAASVALVLYRQRAKTGVLPAELPPGVVKDPFTGQDFLYEVTEDGFTLRSSAEETPGLLACTVR